MPHEVTAQILSFLHIDESAVASSCCRRWRDAWSGHLIVGFDFHHLWTDRLIGGYTAYGTYATYPLMCDERIPSRTLIQSLSRSLTHTISHHSISHHSVTDSTSHSSADSSGGTSSLALTVDQLAEQARRPESSHLMHGDLTAVSRPTAAAGHVFHTSCTVPALLEQLIAEMAALTQRGHLFPSHRFDDMPLAERGKRRVLQPADSGRDTRDGLERHSYIVFFATYRSIMTEKQLLAMLFALFDDTALGTTVGSSSSSNSGLSTGHERRLLSLVKLLQLWIHDYTMETVVYGASRDGADRELTHAAYQFIMTRLVRFSNHVCRHSGREAEKAELVDVCNIAVPLRVLGTYLLHFWNVQVALCKTQRDTSLFETEAISNEASLGAALARNGGTGVCVLDYPPQDIAQQLTISDFELFYSIPPHEFIGAKWRRKLSTRGNVHIHDCPNLMALMDRFTDIALWVAAEIVEQRTAEERADRLRKFLDVASALWDMRNFQTLFAVVAGIQSAAVYRLYQTKALLAEEDVQRIERLRELVGLANNSATLRASLNSCREMACIPYMGLYMVDLKMQHDSPWNSWSLTNRIMAAANRLYVNMELLLREYAITLELQNWQRYKSYYRTEEHSRLLLRPTLRDMINKVLEAENRTDADLFNISLQREPRQ